MPVHCDAGSGKPSPVPVEFVKSKDAKAAQRKWEAERSGAGRAPKLTPLMRAVVLLSSTFGMLLFGYRMYLRHYADSTSTKPQYVRSPDFCIAFDNACAERAPRDRCIVRIKPQAYWQGDCCAHCVFQEGHEAFEQASRSGKFRQQGGKRGLIVCRSCTRRGTCGNRCIVKLQLQVY